MKSKNSLNPLIHGIYASEPTLPWGDAKDYAACRDAIRDELMPDGPLEEETVREIADLQWRKRRVTLGWLLQCHNRKPSPELMAATKGGTEKLVSYLGDLEKTEPPKLVMTTANMLKLIRKIEATGPASGDPVEQALANIISRPANSNPNATADPNPNAATDRDIIQQAYDPRSLEQQLKLEAMIDARITKALGRLANLKEYKRIYGQKSLQTLTPAASLAVIAPINDMPGASAAEPAVHVTSNAAEAKTKKIRQWGDPD